MLTGGATGIGYSMVGCFLERGNKVLICGRTEEKLVEAKDEHPDIEYKVCDTRCAMCPMRSRGDLFSNG